MSFVKVVMRVWPDGSVIALFPEETHHAYKCTSYEHVGQHGAADYDHVIFKTRRATPEQYAPLLKELIDIGYEPRVVWRKPKNPWKRAA